MTRAKLTVKIERARSINLGAGWSTMMAKGTLDEKIIDFFETKPWCHNVANIGNFNMLGDNVVSVDVEYNQA